MQVPVRLGVLNENEAVRFELGDLLGDKPAVRMMGGYHNANDAMQAIRQGRVDVMLMDFALVESDAIEFIVAVKNEFPALRILVAIGERHATTASLLLALGGHGVICRGQSISRYLEAVRTLANGELYVCSGLTSVVPYKPWESVGGGATRHEQEGFLDNPLLSLREREVMRLYISGMKVTQIAAELERSLKTISAQKLSAFRKLGVKSDAELFRAISQAH